MSKLLEKERIMIELRKIFLDNGYTAGPTALGEFNYSEISGFTKKFYEMFEYDYVRSKNIEFWNIIEIIGYDEQNPSERRKIFFKLLDKGFFEKEQDFTAPNSKIFIDILEHIDRLDEEFIDADTLLNQLISKFPLFEVKEIILRMKLTLQRNIPDVITRRDGRFHKFLPSECISDYGIDILRSYYRSKDIFNNTPHKQEMLKEHQWVYEFKNMENYKDAIIKMGSIIEYVVSEWLTRNSHPNPNNFGNKLNILEHLSKTRLTGKITQTNWRIANQIIRDYRNYIHLHLYFSSGNNLTKAEFNSLEPVYQKILQELS